MWGYVDCWSAFGYLLLLAGFIFAVLCVFLYATSSRLPLIIRYPEEFNFKDPSQLGQTFRYPDLTDEPSIDLSVVIPAYEEEKRLPPMLDECLEYLQARKKKDPNFTYEVIIVDDGSRDSTTSVGMQYSLKYGTENVRVLTLAKNRGKGGAVRLGMLSARGRRLLFADADGATTFSDLDKLEEVANELLKQSTNVVVVGSRAHLEKDSIAEVTTIFLRPGFTRSLLTLLQRIGNGGHDTIIASCTAQSSAAVVTSQKLELCSPLRFGRRHVHVHKNRSRRLSQRQNFGVSAHLRMRSIFRTLLMYGFHFLVWLFTVRGIADTQCGFKLFTREAATHLFTSLHVERWAFDVELLYIAQALKFPIAEVAVRWTEIEGSKIVPIWTWVEMGRDLFLIWLRYKIGAWSIAAQPNKLK